MRLARTSDSENKTAQSRDGRFGQAERDIVALGIAAAAIIMFVGTGGAVLPGIVRSWLGNGDTPDLMLTNALILNIALLVFGWRRYNQLSVEVGERRKAEEKARQLAETDVLTGLLNRRSFAEHGIEKLANLEGQHRAVAVLMLDIDNFKQINDIHGHKSGDRAIVKAAERLNSLMPVDGALARLGGDEFAAIVEFDPRTPDKLDQLAACFIEALAEPIDIGARQPIETTVSVGIARSVDGFDGPDHAESTQNLLHHADIAMYHAKKQGKNRYAWFESTMESELRFRNELETGIRGGIAKGEFVPYYEQQIDLESGDLVGFEMLARWNSPQLGIVSPDIFIPIAEEIGVIAELSESLMKQAFSDAKEWDPKLTLSINISPLQLRDPWFSQKLLRLLVASGFPPNRLDIEITESCLHENIGVVRSVVTSLKNQGIQISLDDFGTGYSSLAQLRSLPFDRIKIDRSFVSELAVEGANAKVVEAIVSLGRGLDLPITAEGIENDAVLSALQKMGELKGQGYHYGRPEDAAKTLDRLSRKKLLAVLQEVEREEEAAEASKDQEELPIDPDLNQRLAI